MNLIITDMMPRFNADYGHGTPIRTPGAYRIATILDCPVVDYFFHVSYDSQIKILNKYLTDDSRYLGISLTNMRGHTKDFSQHSLFDKIRPLGTKSNGLFYYHKQVSKILKYVKNNFPQIKVIIGGGQITNISQKGLKFVDEHIDYIFTGESDIAIASMEKLIAYDVWNLGKKPYIFTKAKVIHSDKDYPLTKEYVADNMSMDHKRINSCFLPNEWTFVEISRGCIFNCFFCSYRHSNKRRSIQSIKEELIRNYNEYGTTRYRLLDDTFNDNRKKVVDICKMFRELPFDIEWHSYARTDVFSTHPDLIDIVYDSGCKYLKFGLESTNDIALKTANKMLGHTKANKVLEEVDKRTNGNLYTHSNFIIGLPGETPESIRHTFEWLKSCPLKTYSFTTWHRDRYDESATDIKEMSVFGKDEHNIQGYGNDWVHDTMTSTQAYELYNEGRELLSNVRGPFWLGSDIYPILRTYGIAHEDVDLYMNFVMDQDDGIKKWFENKFTNHTKEYFSKLDIPVKIRNAVA